MLRIPGALPRCGNGRDESRRFPHRSHKPERFGETRTSAHKDMTGTRPVPSPREPRAGISEMRWICSKSAVFLLHAGRTQSEEDNETPVTIPGGSVMGYPTP